VALMIRNTDPSAEDTNQSLNKKGFSETILLIPTLNEADAIASLVAESRECGFIRILVVDGFSTDRTKEAAEAAGALVRSQEFGRGKGCGVRTGMKIFLQDGAGYLCMMDGDGTNIPSHLMEMVRVAEARKAEVVLGSRIRGKRSPHAMNALTYVANLIISFMLGAKFGRLFTDVQTGYWVFTRDAVKKIYPLIRSTGFEIEMEIFVTILKQKLRVCEVPVGFRVRKGRTKFSFLLRLRNIYYALGYLVY